MEKINGVFKSPLFIFFTGQAVAFACWLIISAIGWGKISQQFIEMQEWRAKIDLRIEKMDTEGTQYGRYKVEAELKSTVDRMKYLEEQDRKIDVLVEKVSRIDESLKEVLTKERR